MSDFTVNGDVQHAQRVPKTEFFVYFALIFTLALLPHAIGWTASVIRRGRLPKFGPVARAWKDARAVTPMIFRG